MPGFRDLPGIWHARRAGHAAARAIRRRSSHGILLLYHRIAGPRRDPQWLDVSREHFDAQLAVLARSAAPMPLDEFELRRREGRLPRRAVSVTFDDGYADNLHAAAPALARHRIAATVFVASGMIGATREFWWDDIERVAFAEALAPGIVPGIAMAWSERDAATPFPQSDDGWTTLRADDPTPRHRLYRQLAAALHPLPAAARDALCAEWRAWAAVPDEGRATHRALSVEELRTLAASPGISIGGHTVTHPSLARLSEAEQQQEVADGKLWLERTLGAEVRAFAYPFGTAADVSTASERIAKSRFDYALATDAGAAWAWSPRWRLPRVAARNWNADEFARMLDRWFDT